MADTLVSAIGLGLLRHALTSAGGALVLDGVLTKGESNLLIGAAMVILPAIWSVFSNWQKADIQAVVTAVEAHPEINITPAAQSGTGKPIVTVERPDLPPKSIAMP